jgi:hypothetical protein
MEIFVTKNEQKLGPYSPLELRSRIDSGQFTESDFGWHNGLSGWLPLSQILTGQNAVPQKSSGLAKASFIISIISAVAWIIILVAAGIGANAGYGDKSPLMMLVGLALFANLAVNLVGTILGIVALTRPLSNKWMAVTGVSVNVAAILAVVGLVILGLSMR